MKNLFSSEFKQYQNLTSSFIYRAPENKAKMKPFLLFLLCSFEYAASSSGGASLSDLQTKVTVLEGKMNTANYLLMQISQKNIKMETDLSNAKQMISSLKANLKEMKSSKHGICNLMRNKAPCGDCQCVEDQNLIQRFYCDCRAVPVQRDCKDHYFQGQRVNGLYLVNFNLAGRTTQAYCDQTTDGGGWTVFQRRLDGSEKFFRNWTEYKSGFGPLQHEHWLGNEYIYQLTSQAFLKSSELRVDMQMKGEPTRRWAKYSSFNIGAEFTGYGLHLSGFSGTSGLFDGLSHHNGRKFSTYDVDNDNHSGMSCAFTFKGAWWYGSCHESNLNAEYDEYQVLDGFSWNSARLQFSEMKARRK